MKLSEVLERCPLPEGEVDLFRDFLPDVDVFCTALGFFPLGWSEEFCRRVRCVAVQEWICTDTPVGTHVCFMKLGGEEKYTPVAITIKTARKNPTEVIFWGAEKVKAISDLLHEITRPEESGGLVSMDEEIPVFERTMSYPGYKSAIPNLE